MKIDSGMSNLTAFQRTQPAVATSKTSGLFSALVNTAKNDAAQSVKGGASGPDFTSMTRKDMFDWMNSKISSGEMSLDDSTAFLGMTSKVPVGATSTTAVPLDDEERVNFVQKAQDGIAGALSRNDGTTRMMLEAAMRTMQGYQSNSIDRNA